MESTTYGRKASWGGRARLVLLIALATCPLNATAQEPAAPQASSPQPEPDEVVILAEQQQKTGSIVTLRGNVEIRYRGATIFADEIVYDEKELTLEVRGNVALEIEDDRIEAREGRFDLRTQAGELFEVTGTVGTPPRESEAFLVSENPYYFEAKRVERRADGSYLVHQGWVTNCQPGRPKWRLKVARATLRPGKDVRVYRASFVLKGVPLFVMPYWWISAADTPRKSGFLMPVFGNDSRRGPNIGGSYYWAINPHADLTTEIQVFSRGGWTQRGAFRARPSRNSSVAINYSGAEAGKFTVGGGLGPGVEVSGQFAEVQLEDRWANGFRGVADLSYLSSLRYRQRFAETFNDAVVSEVRAIGFITANPGTDSLNVYFRRYQNFLAALPETSVTLLAAPGVEFVRRPRLLNPGAAVPFYYSLNALADGVRRTEPRFETPGLVQRFDLYPRVTFPLRLGYFSLTPTFGLRATRYGARVADDPSLAGAKMVLNQPLRRITQEATVELGFPALGRVFGGGDRRVKHVVEPRVTYRYLNGVRRFEEILRLDERDLLTDTHEIEYEITQRFFFREASGGAQAREVVRWTLRQKYFFDPTLRGTLQAGKRNVSASLFTLTPFAFADGPRRFSPIISDLRFTGARQNVDFRVDYDTVKSKLVSTRLRLGTRLAEQVRLSATHFATRNDPLLQQRSNQVRLMGCYGSTFRRGMNGMAAVSWNLERDFFQNMVGQVSYNWDCCGIALEFRRLGLGAFRSENEYRFSFTIANVGTFGTVRREEDLY